MEVAIKSGLCWSRICVLGEFAALQDFHWKISDTVNVISMHSMSINKTLHHNVLFKSSLSIVLQENHLLIHDSWSCDILIAEEGSNMEGMAEEV